MGLLKDLNSGKYNLVLIIILFIFMFHQYWLRSCNSSNKEPMADISVAIKEVNIKEEIKEAVKQLYLADVQAIRNLSEIASKLQKEGLVIAGNLEVRGQIIADKDIISNGDIKAKNEISNPKYTLTGLQDSLDNTVKNINTNFSGIAKSLSQINVGMPVFVRFIAKDPNSNYTSYEWVFSMDSELMLVWNDNKTTGIRNKVVDKAKRLGYSLPLSRVKIPFLNLDFRQWTGFVLSIPNGKTVRIFSYYKTPSDNDITFGSGVHYVNNLNLFRSNGDDGFYGIWAGLDSKKYELIPKGYCVGDMYNL